MSHKEPFHGLTARRSLLSPLSPGPPARLVPTASFQDLSNVLHSPPLLPHRVRARRPLRRVEALRLLCERERARSTSTARWPRRTLRDPVSFPQRAEEAWVRNVGDHAAAPHVRAIHAAGLVHVDGGRARLVDA